MFSSVRSSLRVTGYWLLFAAYFSLFQPWGGFVDPDAFYHAKLAQLLAQQGPLISFPWLDLTSLHPHFADQHFLFHFLLIPFVKTFGMLLGTQIAAVVFAGLFLTVLSVCLKRLAVSHLWFWTLLAALSSSLLFRLSLAKASPLALLWFVLGLTALALRKPMIGLVAGLGFALTHGGWIILLASQMLFIFGEVIYARLVEDFSWKKAIGSSSWRTFLATLGGVAFGMVIHPNFPNNFSFLWVQVVKIGLGTPFGRVFLGAEWLPITAQELLSGTALFVLVGLVLLFGLLFAAKRNLDSASARRVIGFALVTAGLLALTLKSRRSIEYLIPLLTLWLASAAALIDERRLWDEAKKRWRVLTHRLWRPVGQMVAALLILLLSLVVVRELLLTYRGLHKATRPFDQFRAAMQSISAIAKPGDRVFHSNWDQFPQLFVLDDRLRYIAGLDPTFLLEANPVLSDTYRDLTLGRVTSTAYAIIHDQFGARFVFVETLGHEPFAQALASDKRFALLYDDTHVQVYRVNP